MVAQRFPGYLGVAAVISPSKLQSLEPDTIKVWNDLLGYGDRKLDQSVQSISMVSIAISLKRIADSLNGQPPQGGGFTRFIFRKPEDVIK